LIQVNAEPCAPAEDPGVGIVAEAAMKRFLVVFYSRTGRTRQLAQAIAQACHGELDEVRDSIDRAGLRGFLRAGYEAWRRRPAAIQPPKRDPRDYDLVMLGTPVWAGHVASPMRSYIAAVRDQLPSIALFCTAGGRADGPRVLREMADLCGRRAVASISLAAADFAAPSQRAAIDNLLRLVGAYT
jgi:flavodoxin